MTVQVLIPTPLQKFTADQATVSLDATSVDELIKALDGTFPGLGNRLCDENGKLRRFLNVYVNSEDIRFLDNLDTPVKDALSNICKNNKELTQQAIKKGAKFLEGGGGGAG